MRPALVFSVAALVLAPLAARPQDNPIGPEFQVNTYTLQVQRAPAVAADSSGGFVVVWQSLFQDGASYGIFGQRYLSTGEPVGSEFRVNTYTTDRQMWPSVAADSSGNFVVVWELRDFPTGPANGVFGQRFAASGTPLGPEFRVNASGSGSQGRPAVAADSLGNFVVVWGGIPQGTAQSILGRRYAASGAPLGAEFQVSADGFGPGGDPSVSADPSGNFVVAWTGTPGGEAPGVFGRRYASTGAPLGPEFRVSTYSGASDVVVDPSGSFIVAWSRAFPGDDVFAQRYSSAGAPIGPEFRVNTWTPSSQGQPSVAADSFGNFVVVWHDYGGNGGAFEELFGQLFASSGTPIGPQFSVNVWTTGIQKHPAVAADPSGHFVVVWESFLQDGSDMGVFGQRYDSMTVPVELMKFGIE